MRNLQSLENIIAKAHELKSFWSERIFKESAENFKLITQNGFNFLELFFIDSLKFKFSQSFLQEGDCSIEFS